MKRNRLAISTTGLLTVIVLGVIIFMALQNQRAKLDNIRALDVPNSWQVISVEDKLVRGFCLGSGSECGYIRKEYFTNSKKQQALQEGMSNLKSDGWVFDTPSTVQDELQ